VLKAQTQTSPDRRLPEHSRDHQELPESTASKWIGHTDGQKNLSPGIVNLDLLMPKAKPFHSTVQPGFLAGAQTPKFPGAAARPWLLALSFRAGWIPMAAKGLIHYAPIPPV